MQTATSITSYRQPKPARDQQRSTWPIIVHSHLGWDWVWQRPQQFLSRLSRRHPVLFVEAPTSSKDVDVARATIREVTDYPNVLVLQTQIPERRSLDPAWADKERRKAVKSVLAGPIGRKFENPVQWFYDPMAVMAFGAKMNERAIVYDCMDELSQFRGAPPELVRRERELLAMADVVFAGGPKIWKAKRAHNSNCYSYGCGVDLKHFEKSRHAETAVANDIAGFRRPILGYMGVVDERIDYDLLALLADELAHASIVMVGPHTKVDPATFPRRKNLHWVGGRDYGELPAYLKAFDVCLMPFALNEATEYINPTKALEYMATGTPIVSTAVEDVVAQFSEVIGIARAHKEFVAKCRRACERPNRAAIQRGLDMAARHSWEGIVRRLERHIEDALTEKQAVAVPAA